jgi:hypothetical protein
LAGKCSNLGLIRIAVHVVRGLREPTAPERLALSGKQFYILGEARAGAEAPQRVNKAA